MLINIKIIIKIAIVTARNLSSNDTDKFQIINQNLRLRREPSMVYYVNVSR